LIRIGDYGVLGVCTDEVGPHLRSRSVTGVTRAHARFFVEPCRLSVQIEK
jgi:hypothetical protein